MSDQPEVKRYDFVCIGSGSAGIHAAVQASKLDKKVAVVELSPDRLGGAWLHTGTIPSKTMREVLAAIYSIKVHVGDHWVGRVVNDLNATRLKTRADKVTNDEEKLVRKHLESNNIDIIHGRGLLESHNSIRVTPADDDPFIIEADKIMLATGSRPRRPANIPFDGWRVVDSDDILRLESLPRSMVVFGAGVIGCEYACIFAALGVKTTVVDARSRIMQTVDQEVANQLKASMEDMGVIFELGKNLDKLVVDGPQVQGLLSGNPFATDLFFFAAGRESTTKHLGLDRMGIKTSNRGAILVNEHFQTDVPNIYATGDAIGPPALAATSSQQGRIAALHAFGEGKNKFPEVYPVGIYTIPELSSVGKTEEELQAEGADYVVGHASYGEVARGYIRGDNHGLLKLLVDSKTRLVLGVHIVGADACNLIHIGLCMMLGKLPIDDVINTVIFNYPTLAEAYRVACFNALNKINPAGHFDEDLTKIDAAVVEAEKEKERKKKKEQAA